MDRPDTLEPEAAVRGVIDDGSAAARDFGGDVSADHDPSLVEDVRTFVTDAKTYVAAELAFQKSRAGFAGARARSSLVYGASALALLHLALIGLVVGLLLALSSLVGPWWATAIVVGVLLFGAVVFALKLKGQVSEIGSVFGDRTQ